MKPVSALLLAALLAAGCVVSQRPPEEIPETPDRIESPAPPVLQATRVPGIRRVVLGEVVDTYYVEATERWFRYWEGKWFIAFTWDGAWFPTSEGELPEVLREFEPTPEEREKRQLSQEEEMREIEERLRQIEREERGGKTREEEMREIEEQLRRIEEEGDGEDADGEAEEPLSSP